MRERVSPRAVLRELRARLPDVLEVVKALPPLAKRLVERSQDGESRLPVDTRALEALRVEIAAGNRRRDRLLLGGLLVLGSVLWMGLGLDPLWVGWAALAGAAAALVVAAFASTR